MGGVVLEILNSLNEGERPYLNRYNFTLPGSAIFGGFPPTLYPRLSQIVMEGWMWLEREGLIAPKPGEHGDWVFITRRGQQLRTRSEIAAYQRADLLPRHLLHAIVAGKAA